MGGNIVWLWAPREPVLVLLTGGGLELTAIPQHYLDAYGYQAFEFPRYDDGEYDIQLVSAEDGELRSALTNATCSRDLAHVVFYRNLDSYEATPTPVTPRVPRPLTERVGPTLLYLPDIDGSCLLRFEVATYLDYADSAIANFAVPFIPDGVHRAPLRIQSGPGGNVARAVLETSVRADSPGLAEMSVDIWLTDFTGQPLTAVAQPEMDMLSCDRARVAVKWFTVPATRTPTAEPSPTAVHTPMPAPTATAIPPAVPFRCRDALGWTPPESGSADPDSSNHGQFHDLWLLEPNNPANNTAIARYWLLCTQRLRTLMVEGATLAFARHETRDFGDGVRWYQHAFEYRTQCYAQPVMRTVALAESGAVVDRVYFSPLLDCHNLGR